MKIRVLKLGTVCHDQATGLEGTLTHWVIGMNQNIRYIFQPRGLDDAGQPVKQLVVDLERLQISEDDYEIVEVPFEILGSQVTDKASGFTGMATRFTRHINGCFHVWIQPKGKSKKTGVAIDESDFDLRGCSGERIIELSPEDAERSKKDTPSPARGDVPERFPGRQKIHD